MADEELMENPEGTPPIEQQTQPPNDLTAPEGTPAGHQEGTPGEVDRAERQREYFQTESQKAKERLKEMVAERDELLGRLGTYEETFGQLDFSAQNQPAPQPQPQPQPQGQEFEFDPYNPDSMKQYLDTQMGTIRAQLSNVAKEAIQQARLQEKYETERQQAMGSLVSWLKKNEISEELQNEAAYQYQMRFGRGGTPRAMVEWVTDYIVKKSEMARADMTMAQRQAEAAEKGKLLAGAQLPPQGAAPSPAAKKDKTWAEKEADSIAPDQGYVYPG